jgi:orotate phosphoribosyltransferase
VNFRSIAQLSDQLLHWSYRLPRDIEAVVGVPRSGLLAANILALYLNVPLTDVDGLLSGRCFEMGTTRPKPFKGRGDTASAHAFLDTPRTVLVVDDSLLSGRTMRRVRETIEAAGLPHQVRYSAVYVFPGKHEIVDHYCEALNGPRVFEWNVLHGNLLPQFCMVLEGVLCRQPRPEETSDSGQHQSIIRDSPPHLVPSNEVGWIVTDRSEAYRAETEAWLQTHGIRYRNLVMADPVARDRPERLGTGSAFKADVYRSTDASLFLESSFRHALEISRLTGRHVLCTESMQLFHPGTVPLPRPALFGDLHPTKRPTPGQALMKLARRGARSILPPRAQTAIRNRRPRGE